MDNHFCCSILLVCKSIKAGWKYIAAIQCLKEVLGDFEVEGSGWGRVEVVACCG